MVYSDFTIFQLKEPVGLQLREDQAVFSLLNEMIAS